MARQLFYKDTSTFISLSPQWQNFFTFLETSLCILSGIILGIDSANQRCCYIVIPSLIGWAHTHIDPWLFVCVCSVQNKSGKVVSPVTEWNELSAQSLKYFTNEVAKQLSAKANFIGSRPTVHTIPNTAINLHYLWDSVHLKIPWYSGRYQFVIRNIAYSSPKNRLYPFGNVGILSVICGNGYLVYFLCAYTILLDLANSSSIFPVFLCILADMYLYLSATEWVYMPLKHWWL